MNARSTTQVRLGRRLIAATNQTTRQQRGPSRKLECAMPKVASNVLNDHRASPIPPKSLVRRSHTRGSALTLEPSNLTLNDAVHSPFQGNLESNLDSLEEDTMEKSWLEVLRPEFSKPYFRKLKDFLLAEHRSHTIYPPLNHVYTWSTLTPLDQVKVVILGQDPYHNYGQAHGLSFSVLPPTKPPGSLKNIYKQISLDFPSFVPPPSGDLSPLAKLGILFLNTSLTVRAHKAGSHANKGWETFTSQVLRAVVQRGDQGVVFMAWGLPAQKACARIGINEERHLLLKSPHPSPLSAHRGFLGNGHFRLANEWLKERYGEEAQIDWTVLSASDSDT